jgi:hypothetical protein
LRLIANQLRFEKRQLDSLGKPALSAVLVLLVFLQMALAASEPLHKFFHADADRPGHECSVTLFAHGQIETSSVDVSVVVPATGFEIRPLAPVAFSFSAPHALPPGRGPPFSV